MTKKVLFLGGAPTQLAPIRYALKQNYHVITCDYLPNNPGHRLAHEYHNISTTDREAVLELARKLRIDGIVAYASDPSAPTAAYVAEQLGLPGNPYASVLTLARKDLFRAFLKKNGFNVPRSESFYAATEGLKWMREMGVPVFIKPVDSSGSKGITYLTDPSGFDQAFDYALSYSREKKVVVEERINRKGFQVAGDGFLVNGELVFRAWADEHFDKLCNGLVPIGQTFPTTHPESLLQTAHAETQRLLTLLGMKTGALNFDFVFSEDDRFYFLELGPRNGGCLIPEVTQYATGVNLVQYTVEAALGNDCSDLRMVETNGYWSSYMVHALEGGIYKDLWLSDRIKMRIMEQVIWAAPGDKVEKYSGSNHTLGTIVLRFEDSHEMIRSLENMEHDIRVLTRPR